MLRYALAVTTGVIGLWMGLVVGRASVEVERVVKRIPIVLPAPERAEPRTDTGDVPDREYVFPSDAQDRPQTRVDTFRVPVVLRETLRVTGSNPVRVRAPSFFDVSGRAGTVQLDSWDVGAQRWTRQEFDVRRPAIGYGLELEGGAALHQGLGPFVSAGAHVRLGRFEPFGRVRLGATPEGAAPVVPELGLRYRVGR